MEKQSLGLACWDSKKKLYFIQQQVSIEKVACPNIVCKPFRPGAAVVSSSLRPTGEFHARATNHKEMEITYFIKKITSAARMNVSSHQKIRQRNRITETEMVRVLRRYLI
ncbi:hypothetical protein RRG08_009945 [Elysia crispata]|uniref:Uncharacterized protein n=1 Tax=Elysia crispata TaxID=231223 RepID=A0AAE1E3F5_9GAST|nr:hypothetical protein RRG08_009945 [Elysia crispata]